MHILIVEDEVRLAEALCQIMKEQRYNVDMVHDGQAGLDYGMSGLYDVIVLDVMLPKKMVLMWCEISGQIESPLLSFF